MSLVGLVGMVGMVDPILSARFSGSVWFSGSSSSGCFGLRAVELVAR